MKTFSIILILNVQCIILFGQTADSTKQQIKSLTYKIFYEFNQKTLDLPPHYRFYATDGVKNIESISRGSNNYQFNELPDSFAIFILEFGTTKIETSKISHKYYSDATIIFGNINNIDELRSLLKKERKKDELIRREMPCNISRSSDLGFPYNSRVKYKKYQRAIKKGKLEYLSIAILFYCTDNEKKRGYSSLINPVQLKKSKRENSPQQ